MIKKVFLIFTFLCFFSVHAQYDAWTPAKILLTNGTSFRGLVKFPKHSGGLISIGSTAFKFKKRRKATTETYGSDEVEEIIFGDEEFATVHYKYVPIKKNKFVLMELLVQGQVDLYTRTVLKSSSTFTGNPNFRATTYYDDAQFYLKRTNEEVATLIAGPNSFGSFISKTKDYFSDCNKIVDYLEIELYDLSNLSELVDDYNLLCE